MPRTKTNPNFKIYPIIVYEKSDCFNGMLTTYIKAREIVWPKGKLKGEVFLLHKGIGSHRRWTVTHRDSGLDLLGIRDHGESPGEAKGLASRRIKEIEEEFAFVLDGKNVLGGIGVQKEMIRMTNHSGTAWGKKTWNPKTYDLYIQHQLLNETGLYHIRNQLQGKEIRINK